MRSLPSRAPDEWDYHSGVKLDFTRPGRPMDNVSWSRGAQVWTGMPQPEPVCLAGRRPSKDRSEEERLERWAPPKLLGQPDPWCLFPEPGAPGTHTPWTRGAENPNPALGTGSGGRSRPGKVNSLPWSTTKVNFYTYRICKPLNETGKETAAAKFAVKHQILFSTALGREP